MIRDLKAFGLALVAMLAMGAVAASAASAQQGVLTTETGEPVTLVGEDLAEGINYSTAFGQWVQCPGSLYTGHKVGATPHEFVPNGSTEFTLTPHFNQPACNGSSGYEVTVEMNSCDNVIALGETTGGENTYGGTAEITCTNPGDAIHSGTWGNSHHESGRLCTIEIPEQSGLTGAHVTDNEDGTLAVKGTATGITVERHGLCLLDGKGTTTNSAELHMDGVIEGVNEFEEPVGISISDEE